MPLFRYEALDRNGKTIVGAMQAASEQEVFGRLTSMGYNPVLAQSAPMDTRPSTPVATGVAPPANPYPVMDYGQGYPPLAPAPPVAANPPQWSPGAAQVPPQPAPAWTAVSASNATVAKSRLTAGKRSIARMFHQLYISFRAGMPAFQAISTVAAQVPEPGLRQALHEISLGVRDGAKISELMERYPRLFTRGDVGMVRAAELSGFLPEAMENLSAQHELDDNAQRRLRIWTWFFHFNVVVFLLLVPCAYFAIPAIEAGFKASAGFAAMGRVALYFSLPATLAYFGFLGWFQWARNNPNLARQWHRILLRIPAVGKINYIRANAVFTRSLQQLIHTGLAADTAWETAAYAVPNLHLADRFAGAAPVVRGTARLSPAMQQTGLLDNTDVAMVATGEATGEIAQSLAYLADRYEEENRVALGAGVVRGAVTFCAWAFIIGGIGFTLLVANFYPQLFRAVEKGVGGE